MRLVTVPEPPEFSAKCLTCGKHIPAGQKVADLDGEAFKAYYHRQCWVKCLTTREYTYWARLDDSGRVFYNVTRGGLPNTDSGYYDLDALKALKDDYNRPRGFLFSDTGNPEKD